MWEEMMCSTSSLCLEGKGHAQLFPFSSCHWLECPDHEQSSWTTRYKLWIKRWSQKPKSLQWLKRPCVICLCIHSLALDPTAFSLITKATLASLLFPTSHTPSCQRASALAEHSFPKYPHGSLPYSFQDFTQISPSRDILWLPYLEFQ